MDVKGCFAVDVEKCDVLGLVLYGHPAVIVVGKERGDKNLHHHHASALSGTPPGAFSKRHETERADNVVRMRKEPSRVKLVQGGHIVRYPPAPALFVLMQSMYAGDYSRSGLAATNSQVKVFDRGIIDQGPWRLVTQCFIDECVQLCCVRQLHKHISRFCPKLVDLSQHLPSPRQIIGFGEVKECSHHGGFDRIQPRDCGCDHLQRLVRSNMFRTQLMLEGFHMRPVWRDFDRGIERSWTASRLVELHASIISTEGLP